MAEPFGRYELVAEIGRGGMAQLYLGRLVGIAGFSKPLAIKRILPHLSDDARFVDMFLNEGRIAARLSHPNICQVFELGAVDGELFLAMEYLEGVPWGELVSVATATGSVRDPLAILRIAACVLGQACEGLAYAHELRDARGRPTPVIHRDISPGNLFVTVDGTCKVLDFGVSKIATDQHETRSGLVKGKLAYMPPEQLKGEAIDARVDVFAMTVVLWEALAGARLFMRPNDFQIHRAILDGGTPPLAALFPAGLGARVDAVLARGLARDRERRYGSIRELAAELRALVADHGGVPAAHEVGGLVRDTFEQRLAERSQLVSQLSAIHEPEPTQAEPIAEPSVTRSVILRDASIAIARPARAAAARPLRARWAVAVLIVAMLAGVALALSTLSRDDERVAAIAGDAAVAVAVDAAVDAVVEIAVDAVVEIAVEPAVDAAAEPVAIEIEPAPARRPPRRPAPAPPPAPVEDARPGFYSVDSNPYATIYIDGKRVDQTPLYRRQLAPGTHRVKAVLADGRSRTFTIRIAPEAEVTSGTLRW